MKTVVIDIQNCSIQDGPGIRTTVFLKGCPLHCLWCHNPESQSFRQELSCSRSLCMNCGACAKVCPHGVHVLHPDYHEIRYEDCKQCGECVKACEIKALHLVGKNYTPDEVIKIVKKDQIFYEQGGGGLTISGGEALSHPEYTKSLLIKAKENQIHTCVETSGFASEKVLRDLLPLVDLFLFDFKVSTQALMEEYVGGKLETILENLDILYQNGKEIVLRCPIIPSVNDNSAHFDAIIELMKKYPNFVGVELMAYHSLGVSKGVNIGKESQEYETPSEETRAHWLNYFHQRGFTEVVFS